MERLHVALGLKLCLYFIDVLDPPSILFTCINAFHDSYYVTARIFMGHFLCSLKSTASVC